MISKNTAFIKFLIELPEPQKRWATMIMCGLVLLWQHRLNEIREINHDNKCDKKIEKRDEKINHLESTIYNLHIDKYNDVKIFRDLHLETERMKIKIKKHDSINQKKS